MASCIGIALTSGCASTHKNDVVLEEKINNVSLGKIQKVLQVGMSGAEVISILGSPNIVTRDMTKHEVWVYDKISTNFAFSNSSGKLALSLWGVTQPASVLYNAEPSVEKSAGASAMTQRTLTLIIKMNTNGAVDDFTYHASSF
jgi:outer membrane protein assembly factor BamE (lipoprotein component of BamABCDE complex)